MFLFLWGLWDCLDHLSDPDLNLVPGICLENCPFHPDFPILLSISFCSRIWRFSWIYMVFIVMFPFSFLILLIWILSLCRLISLDKGLFILLIFSKNQLLVLLIICTVIFVSTSWTSALIVFAAIYSYWVYLLVFVLELSDVLSSCWCMLTLNTLWKHLELWVFLLALLSFYPINFGMLCLHFH